MAPALGLSAGNGPSWLVRKMAVKLLKLKANDVISKGARATSNSGKVIVRKA
ncbi:hypothetical protein BH10ACT10_BH10ACT10_02060 [soil metagenome]